MGLRKMSLLRITNLSLYYAIKEHMSFKVENEILDKKGNRYVSRNQNWVETIRPTIYVDGEQVIDGFYIDFDKGEVKFSSEQKGIVTASYNYCPIDIYDDYPDLENKEVRVPAISIVHEGTDEEAFQLSHGYRLDRYYIIDVYASRSGQRDDMAEYLVELFDQDIPLIDFNLGFPVLSDGGINYQFDKTKQTIGYLEKDSIKMTPERSISKGYVERYIMSLDLILVAYRNI